MAGKVENNGALFVLTSFAKNTNIKTKLTILFVVPVVALIALSSSQTLRMWEQQQSIRVVQSVIGSSIDVFQLALELQKERGLSAGFQISNGKKFKKEIEQQRLVTDAVLAKQSLFLKNNLSKNNSYKLNKKKQNIISALERLIQVRQQIDRHQRGEEFWVYYSNLIAKIIRLVEIPSVGAYDSEYLKEVEAYTIISWLIERIAQERGLLNKIISSDNFSLYDFQNLNGMLVVQRSLISNFTALGDAFEIKSLEAVLNHPNSKKIEQFRLAMVSFPEKRELLDQLSLVVGYGGLVHNFKNYLIRGEQRYAQGVLFEAQKAKEIVNRYLSLAYIKPVERKSLQQIMDVVEAYKNNIAIVSKLIQSNKPIKYIDKSVYVDDRPFLDAMAALQSYFKMTVMTSTFNLMSVKIDKINDIRILMKSKIAVYANVIQNRADILFGGFLLGVVVVIGIMVWLGLIVSNRMLSSLDVMSKTLDAVDENGNFSLQVPLDGDDEIGRMAVRLNHHLGRLETVLDKVNAHFGKVAEGDLTTFNINEELSGDLKTLVRGVEMSSQKIKDALEYEKSSHNVLIEAKLEAEHASQAKSDFLSSMSHELRTPLNAILGFAQVLKFPAESPLDEKQKLAVNHIIKGGEHLLVLINEVLELAQIEAGSYSVTVMGMDAREVIEDSMSITTLLAEKRAVKLENKTDFEKLPWITGDPARLKQILINFLSNAVKYNRAGGRVWFEAKEVSGGFVRFMVSDNGPGIAIDQQNNLFVPFNRLGNEASGIEGTGIGLTITQRLTESMNGKIGFESNLGRGAAFWVDLPIADTAHNETDHTDNRPEMDVNAFKINQPRKILYVEDNPTNLLLMEHIISSIPNAQTVVAHTAEIGLIIAAKEKPDLILMDINLPGINGDEAMRELQNNPLTDHIPVIAISADAMPREIDNYMKSGFEGYLTKPFQVDDVIHLICKHLKD